MMRWNEKRKQLTKSVKKEPNDVENFSELNERCVQLFRAINEYHAAGLSNRKIAKMLRVGRSNVAKFIGGDFEALCRKPLRSGMNDYHDYIVKSLKAGMCRTDIYKET